jgi:hypothetical protein
VKKTTTKIAGSSSDPDYGKHKAKPKEKAKRAKPRRTRAKGRNVEKTSHRYWLTPKAWRHRCSHCGNAGSVAYRPVDGKSACGECIDRLGIQARESESWRNGGAKAGSSVTVRYVDP